MNCHPGVSFVQNLGPKIAAMATFKTQLKNLRQKKEEEDKEAAPAEKSSEVMNDVLKLKETLIFSHFHVNHVLAKITIGWDSNKLIHVTYE